ncbi:uncharacterized protein LOC100878875 [Megachile rotundata]|uniref:uncharacterized protein LOC100878875 n=1 Tax=Megachile rotundata TaxID=143995 RepID=UPI003FCEE8FD
MEPMKENKFQNQEQAKDVFDLHHYKSLKKYLMMVGFDPYNETRGVRFRENLVFYTLIIGIILVFLQLCVVIREMDLDAILDEIPHLLLACLSYIKLKNIFLNKKRVRIKYFKNVFCMLHCFLLQIKILLNFILNDWKILRDELPVLDRITEQGSRLAHMYRVTLMWATIGFIYIPLINPTLDLIIPLNETRPKEQLFGVCYVFINPDDYFTAVFLHMGWTTWVTVYNIITVDSLYILIIHHVCGLFDVCGYQIETIFKRSNLQHYQFKQCVIHHHKALEFFNYLQECSQNMNLMLVAITMILISTTAVQILMHMDQPLDSARFILFFVCSHIHLYIISLFGQIILNHSKTLAERM